MQFQQPGFLYFLFALIIPIIVHLFQLRKFEKIPFTNVAFLKKVVLQTRKSSQLKKWLTLLARLFALACIIIAFAKPFFPSKTKISTEKETVIYLDNSFSMQLEGKRGPLLKRSVQELLENLPSGHSITLLTNDEIFRNNSAEELKTALSKLEFSPTSPTLNIILLRAQQEFSKNPESYKELILISDFQKKQVAIEKPSSDKIHYNFVQVHPENINNVSIDSLFISAQNIDKIELSVQLSYTGENPGPVPISLYNDERLLAKTGAEFKAEKSIVVPLAITMENDKIKGEISIENNGLSYDDRLYFSIDKSEKIKVVALNNSPDDFLQRIFSSEDFDFHSFQKGAFDYNKIASANTLILNELEDIPAALIPILSKVSENGGHLIIIPAKKINISDYRSLMTSLRAAYYTENSAAVKSVIEIEFNNPLYQNVFEDKVRNFQYPTVQSSFELNGNTQNILKYADGSAFLAQNKNIYIFSAALNKENSNFQQSPLIVPTFYNIAEQSLKQPELYHVIGNKSTIDISVNLRKDEIIRFKNNESSFIPHQKNQGNSVEITTENLPKTDGIYTILNGETPLRNIAYNYKRQESDLQYANLEQLIGIKPISDVAKFFTRQHENSEIQELWKWFVIFAMIFLFIEVLLLKFLK